MQWERTVSADAIRAEARAALRPEDFTEWQSPEAQARFEQVFRRALVQQEIIRIKVYDPDMRVVWSDERRLLGTRFQENAHLAEAIRGQTVAHLERANKAENVYERHFAETVELYVPLSFSGDGAARSGPVVGVVEVYKSPARALANLSRDRWTIVVTSLAGAMLLYAVLFGIVHRASRQLHTQREDLERQTAALSAANQELRAMQDQLRASERLAAIGEVSAAVAHGIRNPLANIRAVAQVALDTAGDRDATGKYLGAITAEVDRLGRWLRALLDSVRPFQRRLAPTDVNSAIDDVLGLLADRIGKGAVKVERVLAPDLPSLVADEIQLQQALVSVVENALDALAPGGTLAVRTERAMDGARPAVAITVRDDGAGIPPDRLPRVFDHFYTTKTRGTGLGLAITRKVIEGHGGAVHIASEPGTGTTVRIIIPLGTAAT